MIYQKIPLRLLLEHGLRYWLMKKVFWPWWWGLKNSYCDSAKRQMSRSLQRDGGVNQPLWLQSHITILTVLFVQETFLSLRLFLNDLSTFFFSYLCCSCIVYATNVIINFFSKCFFLSSISSVLFTYNTLKF